MKKKLRFSRQTIANLSVLRQVGGGTFGVDDLPPATETPAGNHSVQNTNTKWDLCNLNSDANC